MPGGDPGIGPGGTGGPTTTGGSGTTGGGPLVESPSPRFIRQLTLSEYRQTIVDLLHIANPDTTAIPPDVPMKGFTTNVAASFVSAIHFDAYFTTGMTLADRAVNEAYANVVPCQTQDATCAGQFVDQFGLHAFRRPLTADEKSRYVKLFDPSLSGNFKAGVSLVISSMVVSPNFLFRTELGDDRGGGNFVLGPYEIATALSYTYWGSMPDDALFASAAAGALANKSEIETQTRRLLADPRGRAHVASFFSEWTEAPRAFVADKDMSAYPNVYSGAGGKDALVAAMQAEEAAFVMNVVFDSTKKWSELFTANYTFANDRLAAYYGLPAPGSSDRAVKVSLPAGSQRGGLVTLGAFLYGHARTNQSSPVQRGHLIRANMFCADVPPPPMGVDATVKPGTPGKTGRAQIEFLTGSGICVTCHGLMNPIGYALEGFGGAAEERTSDNGEPVDTSGQLKEIDGLAAPVSFNGARDLSNLLANNETARACLAQNYHKYTRGFWAKGVDAAAVTKLGQNFVTNNLDLPELFVQVSLQDSFTQRRSLEVLEQ